MSAQAAFPSDPYAVLCASAQRRPRGDLRFGGADAESSEWCGADRALASRSSGGTAEDAPEHAAQDLSAHLAAHRARRLLGHRLHHALPATRAPEELAEHPTGGRISIGDRVVNDLEPKDRDIAMVFQNYALYPHMSVYQNMAYGLKIRKLVKEEIDLRVRKAARILELEKLLDRLPRQLSGGQRQRVAMGRAIVREPAVFLFDEPLSNLDAKLRVQMRLEIKRLQRELDVTSIYVTHDQVEAMTLADRLIVMNAGVAEQIGSPMDVYDRPATVFVAGFIGRTNFVERDGATYSLRPQAIGISAGKPAANGVESEIVDRAYLGEHWDYQVKPLGETKPLRVSTGPNTVYALGSRVWLEIDPAAMVRVE